MQIGPKMDDNTIETINEAGKVRGIHQDNLTQLEKDTLSHMHRQFKDHKEAVATIEHTFPNNVLSQTRQKQQAPLPETIEELQGLFYRKKSHITEFKKPSNITVDTDNITLTRFPLLG